MDGFLKILNPLNASYEYIYKRHNSINVVLSIIINNLNNYIVKHLVLVKYVLQFISIVSSVTYERFAILVMLTDVEELNYTAGNSLCAHHMPENAQE